MIRKTDIIFAAALMLLSLCVFPVFFLFSGNDDIEKTVKVTVDGTLYGEYTLLEEQRIEINTAYGRNCIEIQDGSVRVAEADCPDGYCMHYGWITREGGTIICLPHRLVITITERNGIDAYVQ